MHPEAVEQAARWDTRAALYDAHPHGLDTKGAVTFLAGLAGEGPVLELGVGTGRVAIPLAKCGIPITGLDVSPEMVDRLVARAGGLPITAVVQDMAAPELADRFTVVYAAASTLFMVLTPERQRDCLAHAARLLTPGGCLVIEAATPWASDLTGPSQETIVRDVSESGAIVSLLTRDPARQIVRAQDLTLLPDSRWMEPVVRRYVSPAELDLMAELAGLRLQDRHGDWRGGLYGRDSRRHVSVYVARR
jgi:SAM-dependent methyltransferase